MGQRDRERKKTQRRMKRRGRNTSTLPDKSPVNSLITTASTTERNKEGERDKVRVDKWRSGGRRRGR